MQVFSKNYMCIRLFIIYGYSIYFIIISMFNDLLCMVILYTISNNRIQNSPQANFFMNVFYMVSGITHIIYHHQADFGPKSYISLNLV